MRIFHAITLLHVVVMFVAKMIRQQGASCFCGVKSQIDGPYQGLFCSRWICSQYGWTRLRVRTKIFCLTPRPSNFVFLQFVSKIKLYEVSSFELAWWIPCLPQAISAGVCTSELAHRAFLPIKLVCVEVCKGHSNGKKSLYGALFLKRAYVACPPALYSSCLWFSWQLPLQRRPTLQARSYWKQKKLPNAL